MLVNTAAIYMHVSVKKLPDLYYHSDTLDLYTQFVFPPKFECSSFL